MNEWSYEITLFGINFDFVCSQNMEFGFSNDLIQNNELLSKTLVISKSIEMTILPWTRVQFMSKYA